MSAAAALDPLRAFSPTVRTWFSEAFEAPTRAQAMSWPVIASGAHTLLLAPTGSGKTLAAFLWAIDRVARTEPETPGVRILYISPLKALGVDVQRNLRAPLAGIRAVAGREQRPSRTPTVAVRSGDTTTKERNRIVREPPDVLITTPESLYLMLTSQAREVLRTVDTVIVDEIHTTVPTKRGTHLFVSLERLEALRREEDPARPPAQRIGLSATQRPLEEVAKLLGGATLPEDATSTTPPRGRAVEIVNAGATKEFDLGVEVPVEDMARMGEAAIGEDGSFDLSRTSIWPSIHPRLVELICAHRSTIVFVNSRALAERLAGAINEEADEEIALAHHGSLAKETRTIVEERLKRGDLPAIVATSSLELGIDMGAVDQVIQIEAPPSVAAGIQRIGRAGHQVGAKSRGVIFPKFRQDLLACATVTGRMRDGAVEARFFPKNPLDVLAQQLVAMVSLEPKPVDELWNVVRCAAPYTDLPRAAFESVLDMLAGRYPSDEFAELSPRVNWDRVAGVVSPRRGTQRTAVLNAGTIPDRGLYGVFLVAGAEGSGRRVGELDEEMVFESRPGDVVVLGASSWRVVEITHDRVNVIPAPGEPGRMPFWHGDRPGRPAELGQEIGRLARELSTADAEEARERLAEERGLDPRAAENLVRYLADQVEVTGEVPSDETILVERFLDEVGDFRITVLTPFGSRIHAPWATAISARLRQRCSGEVDVTWTDDGIVLRVSAADRPPSFEEIFVPSEEIEDAVVAELGSTAVFAARFRENAGRALLLPRRRFGKRMPLWVQRRRAADLLGVAARYDDFPIVLETYRECLRDVFDLPGLRTLLRDVERRKIRVRMLETERASPMSNALLLDFVANFLYETDSSLAERKAQTLALDYAQLRELLGDASFRELLDPEVLQRTVVGLQRLDRQFPPRDADGVHDLLRRLGDLDRDELALRCGDQAAESELEAWIETLTATRRIAAVRVGGRSTFIAAEDAARYRDALGVVPPHGLPDVFLEPVAEPLLDLVSRFARTHGPFTPEQVAARFGVGVDPIAGALRTLTSRDRVLEGEFTPGGSGREWIDAEVLRSLKRRSLAVLRKAIAPVDAPTLARFLPRWQGVAKPRRGLEGLLDAIEQLQGAAIPASALEREVLRARVEDYTPGDLDELCAAGEVVWCGVDSLGEHDGKVTLYLTDHAPLLLPEPKPLESSVADSIRRLLETRGALFFEDIVQSLGGYPRELLDALWDLVWAGEVTNDTLAPLRSLLRASSPARQSSRRGRRVFRSRRRAPAGSEGRWSLLRRDDTLSPTRRRAALVDALLARHGVVTREGVLAEGIAGGFAGVYPVLAAMEDAGKVRRGYFVEGFGPAQFCLPGAESRLRERGSGEADAPLVLAATDPANAYGAALPWPRREGTHLARAAGARVVLDQGRLLAWIGRSGETLSSFLPEGQPERDEAAAALAGALARIASASAPLHLTRIDGHDPLDHELADALRAAGFVNHGRGLVCRAQVGPT